MADSLARFCEQVLAEYAHHRTDLEVGEIIDFTLDHYAADLAAYNETLYRQALGSQYRRLCARVRRRGLGAVAASVPEQLSLDGMGLPPFVTVLRQGVPMRRPIQAATLADFAEHIQIRLAHIQSCEQEVETLTRLLAYARRLANGDDQWTFAQVLAAEARQARVS